MDLFVHKQHPVNTFYRVEVFARKPSRDRVTCSYAFSKPSMPP